MMRQQQTTLTVDTPIGKRMRRAATRYYIAQSWKKKADRDYVTASEALNLKLREWLDEVTLSRPEETTRIRLRLGQYVLTLAVAPYCESFEIVRIEARRPVYAPRQTQLTVKTGAVV